MSDLALTTTVHVDEDTSATLSLRDIMAQAGYVTDAALTVEGFETQLPNGEYIQGDTPLLGLADGEHLYIRPGAWQKDYNGQFATYQFLVEDGEYGNYVSVELRVVIDPVNDAPTGADRDFDLVDRTPVVLAAADFGFADAVEGHGFQSVIIESLPAAGTILLNGDAVAAGSEIAAADIAAGKLTFVPSDTTGGIVEMGFHVRDNGGTTGTGAQDTSVDTNYLSFKVPMPAGPGTGAPTLATIGDTVWEDNNGNGLQDAGEAGIANATVALRDADGNVIQTTTTDADGQYKFEIGAGSYIVAVTAPKGYVATDKGVGSDGAVDSDIDASGLTDAIAVAKGDVYDSADAGLYRYASVSSTVWNDTDGDGKLDADESGIANVAVSLLDADGKVVATASTDAGGHYKFGDLKPGTYSLQFDAATLPEGVTFASGNGSTAQVTLSSGQDAVFEAPANLQLGSIASTVWEDANANGVRDSGETGIAGASVSLVDARGNTVATTTTDEQGNYAFTTAVGNYSVQVAKPAGYAFTGQNVGANDAIDSDVNAAGASATFAVKANATVDPADAGLYRGASLGNKVWYDCDGDGIQDAGESGIQGAKVTLLDAAGKALSSTVTNASGSYAFTGLKPGTYSVQFDTSALPAGYTVTKQNAGGNDALDSDIDAKGLSQQVTLASGENNTSIDAGVAQMASIGNRVWLDTDADGIQDSGECGVGNVLMTLKNAKGDVVATTTTDSNGYYNFNVAAGTYSVSMKTPDGYGITKQYATDAGYDSNADAKGYLGSVTVGAGQAVKSLDAGLTQTSIRSTVWEDSDFDGVQDKNECGIGGVTVKLYDANHKLKATTVTAADGSYAFNKLAAGSYSVEVTRPGGYHTTKANVGSDATDSDFANLAGSSTIASSGVFKLAAGQQKTDVDAGLYRKASIGDKVWRDANHNGVQDRGEEGIGKIKVMLFDATSNKLLSTTTTDSKGSYLFSNLDPGSYYLKFDKTDVKFTDAKGLTYAMNDWKWGAKNTGSNDHVDSDVKGDATSKVGLTQTDATFLYSGENDMSWDAAITPIAIDLDGNGIHTIARADFTGSFDLLGTGTAIQSGWLSAGDAFLAIDANGNGSIDGIAELFGGASKGSGFAKLASFDSNGDGFVTAGDAQFAALTLWQDANSNGITDGGELISLAQAGVTSLAVAFEELPFLDANGNLHLERSSAVVNGQEVSMTDVYFNVAAADAAAAGIDAANMAELVGQPIAFA
ncbi:carboxypeptidase regulatory-like domain-containing protein [Pseudoduganella sp. SL102]|uniref:SdrD B-like domain-containing protein n=1 Tax=Pseudoduganella sp. SL102 TaxID=2995154 RepID=UPI00248C21D7|nr:SdrD B-like domain-containing protein [Pseudoduganella sp. SL102]WBS05556.1 carboxypeptidase regulatory-like domain-containing protein [Pseudoduganella sp. SL102]